MTSFFAALKSLAGVIAILKGILRYFNRRALRKEGERNAYTKVQNDQIKSVDKGLAAQQKFDADLVSNPGSLRDDDRWLVPDEGSPVQPTATSSVAEKLG